MTSFKCLFFLCQFEILNSIHLMLSVGYEIFFGAGKQVYQIF